MSNTQPTTATKEGFDSRAFLSRAGPGISIEKYPKNHKVFSQGDAADAVYFVQKGKVKITVLSEHGKEAVVGIVAEGHFFGEGCLEGAKIRGATSQAMEDCVITSITKGAMLTALGRERQFSAFAVPQQPDRGGSDRPAVQFQRKAAGAAAAAAGEFWQGRRR